MMKIKCLSFRLCVAALALSAGMSHAQISGFDQVGTTSLQFLKVIPNAKAAAMGGVGAATINSSEALFFNPAAITRTPKLDVALSYLDWFLDVKLTSVALTYELPSIGTLGFHALVNDLGEIEETRVDHLFRDEATGGYNPGTTGNTLSASAVVVGLSFAKGLTDKFSFGLTAKYAREDLGGGNASALMFDGGLIYDTGFRTLALGAMLRNFGPEVKYFNESYPLPQTFTIGLSGNVLGAAEAFVSSTEKHSLVIAFDLSQARDNSQQQLIGAEYTFSSFLSLRSGYKFNFDEEGLTLGFGLKVSRFQFDYGYNDFGEFLDSAQRFTLNFTFE